MDTHQTEQIEHLTCAEKSGCAAGLRIAAAGVAGTLLAAGLAGNLPADARQVLPEPVPLTADKEPSSRKRGDLYQNKKTEDQKRQQVTADALPTPVSADWDEDTLLKHWDLDPEDFPRETEEAAPEIPEDLVPFFQEQTASAVQAWSGAVPPRADMSAYSPRADAIRAAVRQKAEVLLKDRAGRLTEAFRTGLQQTGTRYFAGLSEAVLTGDPDTGSGPAPGQVPAAPVFSAGGLESGGGTDGDEPGSAESGESSVYAFLHMSPSKGRDADRALSGSAGQEAGPSENAGGGRDADAGDLQDPDASLVPALALPETSRPWWKLPVPRDLLAYTPGQTALEEEATETPEEEVTETSEDVLPGYTAVPVPFADPGDKPEDPAGDAEYGQESRLARRTVFIGDSRTVGMEMFVGGEENEYWSARNSMGYSWMVDTGVPAVEDLIGEGTDVVILMGVNDLGNVYRYADYINMKAEEWKKRGAETYFVSVTPVDDRRSPNAKNSRIESFNAYMQETLRGVHYIDAYSRIRYSFGSPDGIHFDGATYREIYRIIRFYLYKGWYEENGLWFWFDHGRPQTGWLYLDGQWQYMDGNGVRWVRNSRVGDIVLAPYPETEILDPCRAVLH